MDEKMTQQEFAALVAAYGAEPRRWPEDRRAAAEAFLASGEAAKRAAAPEARLDALLDAWKPRAGRVVEEAEPDIAYLAARAGISRPHPWRFASRIALSLGVAVGLMVGVVDLADQIDNSSIIDSLVTAMLYGEDVNS